MPTLRDFFLISYGFLLAEYFINIPVKNAVKGLIVFVILNLITHIFVRTLIRAMKDFNLFSSFRQKYK